MALAPRCLICLAATALACGGGSGGPGGGGGDDDDASDAAVGPDAARAADAAPDPCDPLGNRPGVCPARGLYDDAIDVELRAPDGAQVVYTLDGSPPDAGSTAYDGPIAIAPPADRGVVIVRARAIDPSTGPGPIVTHSYVFPAAVLAQSAAPAGLPAVWGTSETYPADYEMDGSVLGDAAGAAAALGALPVVSLALAPDDLWGAEQGLYMNPENGGIEWERAASIEIFGGAEALSTQEDCGARIQGGSSQNDWKVPKLSMRVIFRETYGADELEASLFAGDAARFDTLVLDAHLNWTWVHPAADQRLRADYLRDRFTSDLQLAIGSQAPRGRFVHLFLGGLYWGLYELHERPDEHFAAAYLGGDDADYDVIKHGSTIVVNGDGTAWDAMFALARQGLDDDDRYAALAAQLDVPDFIDYMLVNFFAGNDDWPHHNWYAARRKPDGLWRFFSWDAEHTLKQVDVDRTGVDAAGTPGELYQLLAVRADFRAAVSARGTALLAGPFAAAAANDLYQARADEVRASIVLESARWGDSRSPDSPSGVTQWEAEQSWLEDTYFPQRPAVFAGQLPE
ncbi:MAG TPA: CotH kinase family protein [Kofleriaceae bacterium]|nr:CotH kinase family protein [Kofleriaceae bacterium]